MASENRKCKACRQEYVIEPDDFGFYEKMGVPAPVNCPECRFRLRAVWRSETTLYSRQCGLCKKNVVSMYHPKSPYQIYCEQCWNSDKWDRFSYGRDYDSNRPFFDQLRDLILVVPKEATFISSHGINVNSEYTNCAGDNKNCYLVFNGGENEDVSYARGTRYIRDSADLYYCNHLERSYECINVNDSNGIVWGQHVSGCVDSWLILNASALQNCFGCVNLRGQSYHFFNEPLKKDEYTKRINEIIGSYSKMQAARRQFEEFSLKFPRRENANLKTVNSVGDYLTTSKNLRNCFEATECEDCAYGFSIKNGKDCHSVIGYAYNSELLYECVGVGYSRKVLGTFWGQDCADVEYSFAVINLKDSIGCDGLKGAQFCILNKRYSEEEYKKIHSQIINQLKEKSLYGEMLPVELCPWAYNETVGQDNFPLTKEQTLAMGFRWQDELQMTKGKETLRPEQIPDHIKDVQDSILKDVLACITCRRNYRLIPAELQFYRKMILPIPRQCFYCRHADRLQRRGPMKIFDRQCAKCQKTIKTTYASDRPEIVYCEACYQQEVV